jgi:hypothetical protein
VYSYVFGDGDPNPRLEEQRLSRAAAAIRAKGGAVAAEELAPFLDPPELPKDDVDAESASAVVDEQWVLPLLAKLGGIPKVSGGKRHL